VYRSANNRSKSELRTQVYTYHCQLCSQLQGPLAQDKSCLAEILIQMQITLNYVIEIQNTKCMQCILNTYFKYLYFKYFTTLWVAKWEWERIGNWLMAKMGMEFKFQVAMGMKSLKGEGFGTKKSVPAHLHMSQIPIYLNVWLGNGSEHIRLWY